MLFKSTYSWFMLLFYGHNFYGIQSFVQRMNLITKACFKTINFSGEFCIYLLKSLQHDLM